MCYRPKRAPYVGKSPGVYQEENGVKTAVPSSYSVSPDGGVSFRLGSYDRSRKLVIDPTLVFSTFLGGADTELSFGWKVGDDGSLYLGGNTYSANFPTTAGAPDTTLSGLYDGRLTKINSTGTAILFSTYIGGASLDLVNAVVVGSGGNVFVAGQTLSSDFPVTPGAFQTSIGGSTDAFATKFSSTNGTIVYSTYLGGSGDDNAYVGARTSSGNLYIAGGTMSPDFPTTGGAYDRVLSGGSDGYILRLNPDGTGLDFSTLFGGSGEEIVQFSSVFENRQVFLVYGIQAIALDATGNIYVTGTTTSTDLPTSANALHGTYLGGDGDGYATKLDPTASSVLFCTYLGGRGFDAGTGIQPLSGGAVLVSGVTGSDNVPTTAGAFDTTFNGGPTDLFVQRINGTATSRLYSSYFGTAGEDFGSAFLDASGDIFLAGSTTSASFPTTADAIQPYFGGGLSDAFVSVLDPSGTTLGYSTYFGGSSTDQGTAQVDASGFIYIVGTTVSSSFPVTPGAYDTTYNGGNADAFAAKLTPLGTGGGPGGGTDIVLPPSGTVNSALSNTSNLSSLRASSYAARFALIGRAGQQVAITVASASFDTYLYLIGPDESVIAQDDDGAGGSNSRIPAGGGFRTLTQTGRYIVEVTSFNNFGTGSFTLTINSIFPPELLGVFHDGVWAVDVDSNGIYNAAVDRLFGFGFAGTTPVTGDWNGDGKTKAGFYMDGLWYLDYNGNGVWEGRGGQALRLRLGGGGRRRRWWATGTATARPKWGSSTTASGIWITTATASGTAPAWTASTDGAGRG